MTKLAEESESNKKSTTKIAVENTFSLVYLSENKIAFTLSFANKSYKFTPVLHKDSLYSFDLIESLIKPPIA